MKRVRDDLYPGGSQFKCPFGSSRGGGDDYGQSPNHGEGAGEGRAESFGGGSTSQKLTTNDALSYLKEVKDMFRDQREKYDKFLEVMKNFKAQRMDTAGVITRVKELFKGHNNLILGFNTFLPKGYEITLDEDDAPTKKTVEFEEAISFVNKIKKRFQNDEHVYKTFLDILNKYRKEHKDINEVSNEVGGLFADHPDLLEEFSRFLPDNSVTQSVHAYGFGRSAVQRLNDRNLTAPNLRQMQIDKQNARRDRIIGRADPDHLDMEDDKASMKLHKDQKKHFEREDLDRKHFEVDDRESDHGTCHFSDKRKSARKVEHSRTNSNFIVNCEKDGLKNVYSQGFIFCEKVKERLCSSDDYQTFLKCLNIYSNGIIKRKDLQSLVTDLLGKHEDLTGEFNEFLERCESIDGFLAGVISRKSLSTDGPVSQTAMTEIRDIESRHDIEGDKERERCREKYWAKSIQELDLSDCQRCTPSYRLLPNDYPIPSVSQRTELGAQVINENWVSVTSGSEDYSFKHMRRNQFEESLFRCEDDRFELDMLLESVSSTMKRVEEVLASMNENIKSLETPIQVENYFSALNLRCIERLYGDHGLDVIDIIRKNPVVSLPVILSRLRQKQEEWTKCRSDFNRIWADIYAKNHYRSLDHRSFYFKQKDSKNLSMKSLVTEIKELKEKRQTEDDIILSFATGNGQAIIPQLECEYSDLDTLEDLYRLVRYSCEEVCSSKEQFNKVMRLWTNFLEPLVGIPTRPSLTDSAEVRKKSKHMVMKSHGRVDSDETDAEVVKTVSDISEAAMPNGDTFLKEGSNSHVLEMKPKSAGDCSLSTLMEKNHERTDIEIIPVESSSNNADMMDRDSKTNTDEEGNAAEKACNREIPLDSSNTALHLEESMAPSKPEKEEGELSPSGDMEDDMNALPDALDSVDRPQNYQLGTKECVVGKDGGGNDADADDEESGNVSETGGDGSGSDSGADEGSREEAEEEEEDLHEGDGKSESEGEEDDRQSQSSGNFLSSAKPLSKYVPAASLPNTGQKSARLLYANDDLFFLFRLHQILYERILLAKTNSLGNEMKQRTSNEMKQRTLNEMKHRTSNDAYARFMSALYNLLDGTLDNTKFEDECRDIIGNHSYVLFTLDKLIFKLVKQLLAIVSEDIDNKLLQLYEYEKSRKDGRTIDCMYYKNTRFFLHNENIYRLEFMSNPTCMSIQLMDTMNEKPEVYSVSIDPNFASYLHDDLLLVSPGKRQLNDVYLKRNKPKHADEEDDSLVCNALDSVHIISGLECKITCSSSKISYVLDTEDLLFRRRRKPNASSSAGVKSVSRNGERIERFNRFLLDAVAPSKPVAQP